MGETESYEFRAILNCPPRTPLSARKDNGLSLSRHHPERPRGRIADHIAQVGEQHVCTSIIVAAELRYVLPRKPLRVSLRSWKPCWAVLKCLPWNRPSTQFMARLERAGHSSGANDLLIAAHASALEHTIVTDNEHEFSWVPDLRIENWLR